MGLRRYIAKRLFQSVVVMWAVATVVFFGLRAIPGGPVRTMLGKQATPEKLAQLRAELGLDRPLYVQYVDWLTDIAVLDFGRSIGSGGGETVGAILASAAPKTFSIGLVAIVVGLGIALPAGIVSATRRRQPSDYVATVFAFLGLSMPAFFIGILLALVFGVWFNVLPVFGYTPLSEGVVPWFKSILLPGIAVGLPYAAVVMRMVRSSVLEELGQQYMRVAHAKGVGSRVRLYKHALPNALIPVVTIAGIQIALILVGSLTVELVFGIRGLGRVLVESILNRNYPTTQGVIIVTAGMMVLANLVVDILYTAIDPRIRYGEREA